VTANLLNLRSMKTGAYNIDLEFSQISEAIQRKDK
jgi:hypothetical protein